MHATVLQTLPLLGPLPWLVADRIPAPINPSTSKAKQPTPPLPKRIYKQRTHEQAHGDPNRNLNHAVRDIEDITIDTHTRSKSSIGNERRPISRSAIDRLIRKLICRRQPADQTASRSEARWHLDEDGREERGRREAVVETAIKVSDDADGESAEGVCDLGV